MISVLMDSTGSKDPVDPEEFGWGQSPLYRYPVLYPPCSYQLNRGDNGQIKIFG